MGFYVEVITRKNPCTDEPNRLKKRRKDILHDQTRIKLLTLKKYI